MFHGFRLRADRCLHARRLLILLFLYFFPLFSPGSGQRELEIDVAFVARILHELFLIRQPPHHEFHAIRFRPGSWIIQRESVKQVRVIQALPALGRRFLTVPSLMATAGIEYALAPDTMPSTAKFVYSTTSVSPSQCPRAAPVSR